MNYVQLESRQDLAIYLDELIQACSDMIAKTGSYGQTPIGLVNMMMKFIDTDELFLLVGVEDDVFQGFTMALLIPDATPWVEFIALWTRPGVGRKHRDDVWDILKAWSRVKGAKRIMTTITRNPEVFYRIFHKPLGFQRVGYILEAEI